MVEVISSWAGAGDAVLLPSVAVVVVPVVAVQAGGACALVM